MAGKKEVKKEEVVTKAKAAIAELNGKYGVGTVIMGDTVSDDVESVDTGSLMLNLATGCGGYAKGTMIELSGPESVGKSSLLLHAIANHQRAYPDKRCALVDFEQSFDRKYAISLGVDVDNLIISQPTNAEEGYNIMATLIRTGELSLCCLDSHTAMLPKSIVDSEMGDSASIASQARVHSIGVGKIKPLLKPFGCTWLITSQLRTKLSSYIVTQEPTGGNAFKFYSDMRIKLSKKVDAKAKEDESNETTAIIYKNKMAVPFKKAIFNIIWGKGVDRIGEIIDLAVIKGLITKGGAGWYTIGETKLQGIPAVKEFMEDNPEFYLDMEEKLLK